MTVRAIWRRIRFPAGLAVCAAMAMAASSCALLMPAKTRDSKNLLVYQEKKNKIVAYKKADFGGPEDHTLAFGMASVGDIFMTQLDSRLPPVHAELGIAGVVSKGILGMEKYNVFFAPPVKVGSKMQTTYYFFSYSIGRTTYIYRVDRAINSHDEFAYVAAKPGLLYVGDFAAMYDYSGSSGLIKKGADSELACLKRLISKFRKTEWEPVIKARIEELSK